MNIRDLEYLVALEELKHFRKAAERCFVSQPTLSGQLQKLEDFLGVQLIERSSRKVIFTSAGTAVAQQARKVLMEVKGIIEVATEFKEPMSGTLRIGSIPTVAPYLFPKIVPKIRLEFAQLELWLHELQTSELLKQLANGELDCLLLAYLPGMEQFDCIHLYDEPLLLTVPESHLLAKNPEAHLGLLKGERVLMLEDGHCLRDQAMDYCFAAGALEDQSFKATSLETLRNMVAANAGITLLPELSVPLLGCRDGVCYKRFNQPEPVRTISLLYRKKSPRSQCFEQLAMLIKTLQIASYKRG